MNSLLTRSGMKEKRWDDARRIVVRIETDKTSTTTTIQTLLALTAAELQNEHALMRGSQYFRPKVAMFKRSVVTLIESWLLMFGFPCERKNLGYCLALPGARRGHFSPAFS